MLMEIGSNLLLRRCGGVFIFRISGERIPDGSATPLNDSRSRAGGKHDVNLQTSEDSLGSSEEDVGVASAQAQHSQYGRAEC